MFTHTRSENLQVTPEFNISSCQTKGDSKKSVRMTRCDSRDGSRTCDFDLDGLEPKRFADETNVGKFEMHGDR
eukprot:6480857-Amphidinium_carterae.1